MSKLGLGKGLSSLLGSEEGSTFGDDSKDVLVLNISQIEPNINQPRKDFEPIALEELSQSIKQHGMLSPILVREISKNRYQIIAGERRFRASQMINLTEIPVRIIEADDKKVSEIALIENLQREDLNALEEALGYQTLMNIYSLTQEQVAKSVSKSRSSIANSIRILNLDDEILSLLKDQKISQGHARAILSVTDKSLHMEFAKTIIEKTLNVRQAENYAKTLNKKPIEPLKEDFSIYFKEIENKVEEALCRKVKIVHNKKKSDGKGKVELEYFNNEDLENLINTLATLKM